jgi:alpha-galactosidase
MRLSTNSRTTDSRHQRIAHNATKQLCAPAKSAEFAVSLMPRHAACALIGSLCGILVFAASCNDTAYQMTTTIRTNQTIIELGAQEDGPQVLSLGTWRNKAPEQLIDSAVIDGRQVPVSWKFNKAASTADARRVVFVYNCGSPKLQLTWEWRAPVSSGPVEHTIHIQNREAREIWIALQNSFEFKMPVTANTALENFYIEKGAGKPSAIGTHRVAVPGGYHWNGTSSTYAHPAEGEPREVIAFFAIEETAGARNGWYVGTEFSGRTRLRVDRDATSLHAVVGFNPDPGPFRSRLQPNGTFHTPTVFVGASSGGEDALGNVLRPWVREVLGNPRTWQDLQYPLLVNNSWGSGMQVDEALAQRMIRDSAELGLEMFHVDAGWFRGVGDWYPDPKKFPHGLAAIADDAHRHGLKFGIWVDWTQAGLDSERGALNLRDPAVRDWTVSDVPADWKPEPFKGQTIDIGVPAARDYAKREVFRMVEEYHLDMLEHDGYLVAQGCIRTDHPHAPPDFSRITVKKDQGSYFVESSNSTDVSYHAVRAYYDIYSELRKKHPNVLLEVCNDGGRMVDFGSAAHADYFSITDSYDPLSNRRALYDASHLLPAAMLESYIEKWPTPRIENFRYMLRSGMMGWLTIMQDTNAWSAEQHEAAKREIETYKRDLRPLIRDGDIYHISPRPDGIHWDGMEFFDPRRNRGVLYVFRGSMKDEADHTFQLQGLVADRKYHLHFQDHSEADGVVSGRELKDVGLTVRLSVPESSDLVFIEGS